MIHHLKEEESELEADTEEEKGKRKWEFGVQEGKRPSRRAKKRNGLTVKLTSTAGDVPLALMLPSRSASFDLTDKHF